MAQDSRAPEWSRRQVLEALGLGALAATLPGIATAAAPVFPKGAVIRTILKNSAPKKPAGGATLFHEPLSSPDVLMRRGVGYAAATRAAKGAPARAAVGAGRGAPAAGRGTPPAPAGP